MGQFNSTRWKDWRLVSLVEADEKERQEKEKDAPDIGKAQKVAKPKTDNEGKRETVQINGIKFYLDADNITSKTGHTITWAQLCSLYEYGKENKYYKE